MELAKLVVGGVVGGVGVDSADVAQRRKVSLDVRGRVVVVVFGYLDCYVTASDLKKVQTLFLPSAVCSAPFTWRLLPAALVRVVVVVVVVISDWIFSGALLARTHAQRRRLSRSRRTRVCTELGKSLGQR